MFSAEGVVSLSAWRNAPGFIRSFGLRTAVVSSLSNALLRCTTEASYSR